MSITKSVYASARNNTRYAGNESRTLASFQCIRALVWFCGAALCIPAYAQPPEPGGPGSGRRVLAVIGVGTYQNSDAWSPVQAAEVSAREVLKVIPQAFGYVAVEDAPLGNLATAARVSAYLDQVVSRLSAEDDLIVYFAGHGVSLSEKADGIADPVGYLAPYDAPAPDASAGLLKIRTVLEKLDSAPSRNVLVILDACKSGVALPRLASDRTRGNGRIGVSRVLITSAEARQPAIADGGPRGATLFTGILLDLLETGKCDISGDGYCTATELALLARRRLAALSSRQTPTVGIFGGDESADFRLKRFGPEAQEWDAAKSCNTVEECADTSKIERFLDKNPAGVYAAAAKKLQRDRLEEKVRRTGNGIAGDLRLVSVDSARKWVSRKQDGSVFMWVPDKEAPFWMQKLEVSVKQFQDFWKGTMPRAPSFNRGWTDGRQPMVNISWPQAQAFCASIGGTLPSVAQWAFAARADRNWKFPWNDEEKPELANLAGSKANKSHFPAPVDAYERGENEWKIRNLIGNVSEWTSTLAQTDTGERAVVAGGSFAEIWQDAGLQWKKAVELTGNNTVGFRCIVIPDLQR